MSRTILLRDALDQVQMGTCHDQAPDVLEVHAISANPDRGDGGLIRLHLSSGEDEEHPWYGIEPEVKLTYDQARSLMRTLAAGLDAIDEDLRARI